MVAKIDPIAVKEHRNTFANHENRMRKGVFAASALLWFEEYATERLPSDVVKLNASLVASSTPGAQEALPFVIKAAEHYHQQIIDLAVELAMTQYNQARHAQGD